MKCVGFICLIFVATVHAQSCKYGLYTTSGPDGCSTLEAQALARVAAAKSICLSENSTVTWNKNSKEPTWAWSAIAAGESTAVKDFDVRACDHADLVVKYVYHDMTGTVRVTVTDADSGNTVFAEGRDVSDLRSDAIRMADHWLEMVTDARDAALAAQAAAAEAQREQAEAERQRKIQAKQQNQETACAAEFDSLKQSVSQYADRPNPLPIEVVNRMTVHNKNCPSHFISLRIVQEMRQADIDAEHQRQETELKEKRAALLDKEKADAFLAWKQRLATTPFVPPVAGWMEGIALPNLSYYIILPSGPDSNCHFGTDNKSRPVVDCLGSAGRNNYVSVKNGDRWYLLKSSWEANGSYAAEVKDGGTKVCLRKAGCYRVLAEVRPVPESLPDKIPVPAPGALTKKYAGDDFSFAYPQNWDSQEVRDNNKTLRQVNVTPVEARLGSWSTHGFFVGHVTSIPSSYPQTVAGAWNHWSGLLKQAGFAIDDPKSWSIGGRRGLLATYSQPSVFSAQESGWIAVVKDEARGYYWIILFCPSNDDTQLYQQEFTAILNSFTFAH